jgi:IclR family acetate operon transcriptional repressor
MSVKSALRTLQILEVFAGAGRPLSLGELARGIDAPRSSCLALLTTLSERGYVYRVGEPQGWYPTRRWADLARAVCEHDPVALHVHAALERLRDTCGETAIDAMLAGGRSVYVDVVESREMVRYTARAGDSKPLHLSASGRAQLAALDDAACREIVASLPSGSTPGQARLNRRVLLDIVAHDRARGWSVNLGEFRPDVISVAAGFTLGTSAHSLSIAAPYHRIEARVDQIGRMLRDEAGKLAARIQ